MERISRCANCGAQKPPGITCPYCGADTVDDATGSGASPVLRCPSCGKSNIPEARHCEGCGATLARPCTHCGSSVGLNTNHCSRCGRKVPHDEDAVSAATVDTVGDANRLLRQGRLQEAETLLERSIGTNASAPLYLTLANAKALSMQRLVGDPRFAESVERKRSECLVAIHNARARTAAPEHLQQATEIEERLLGQPKRGGGMSPALVVVLVMMLGVLLLGGSCVCAAAFS